MEKRCKTCRSISRITSCRAVRRTDSGRPGHDPTDRRFHALGQSRHNGDLSPALALPVSQSSLERTPDVHRITSLGLSGVAAYRQALDGGICRIKLDGGSISADQADAVAEAAERFAGGAIEATNRANLQIRGIGEQSAALIDSLLAAGLGRAPPPVMTCAI